MFPGSDHVLRCTIRGEACGIALTHVAEIIDPLSVQPIPLIPPFFPGMMLIYGVPVPVLDLAAYLEIGPVAVPGQVLVVAPDIADLALWVDSVERIESAAEMIPPAPAMAARLAAAGCLADGGGQLLDVWRLVECLAAVLARR